MNEIIAISIPQMEDDLDIFEDVRIMMQSRGFIYIDMKPEFNETSITYRFQRENEHFRG